MSVAAHATAPSGHVNPVICFQSAGQIVTVMGKIDRCLDHHLAHVTKQAVAEYAAMRNTQTISVLVTQGEAAEPAQEHEMRHDYDGYTITISDLQDGRTQLDHVHNVIERLKYLQAVMTMLSTTDMLGTSQTLGKHMVNLNAKVRQVQNLGVQLEQFSKQVTQAKKDGTPVPEKALQGIVKQLRQLNKNAPPDMRPIVSSMLAQVKEMARLPIMQTRQHLGLKTALPTAQRFQIPVKQIVRTGVTAINPALPRSVGVGGTQIVQRVATKGQSNAPRVSILKTSVPLLRNIAMVASAALMLPVAVMQANAALMLPVAVMQANAAPVIQVKSMVATSAPSHSFKQTGLSPKDPAIPLPQKSFLAGGGGGGHFFNRHEVPSPSPSRGEGSNTAPVQRAGALIQSSPPQIQDAVKSSPVSQQAPSAVTPPAAIIPAAVVPVATVIPTAVSLAQPVVSIPPVVSVAQTSSPQAHAAPAVVIQNASPQSVTPTTALNVPAQTPTVQQPQLPIQQAEARQPPILAQYKEAVKEFGERVVQGASEAVARARHAADQTLTTVVQTASVWVADAKTAINTTVGKAYDAAAKATCAAMCATGFKVLCPFCKRPELAKANNEMFAKMASLKK